MIYIGKLRLTTTGNLTKLIADITIDGKKSEIWFEVKNEYAKYLCYERSDAFVVAVLNYAMRNGLDITCESPIGEDIYYQLESYFIDAVVKGDGKLHRVRLFSDIDYSELPCEGAVGTGISGGIDSLQAIAGNINHKCINHNITHLAFNNVGSHGEGEAATKLYLERKRSAESFCKEYGFKFVESNSNIMDVIKQNHFLTHTYTSSFAILALQKLYKYYYYASSGDDLLRFSVVNNSLRGTSYYDFLSLQTFSTQSLKIYSQGASLSRLEKTQVVTGFRPSYKYLNVCTKAAHNCSRCEKCTRTLLALEILGKLDLYNNVFDVDYYLNNKQYYYKLMCYYYKVDKYDYIELYHNLKKNVTFLTRCKSIPMIMKTRIGKLIPEGKFKGYLQYIIK